MSYFITASLQMGPPLRGLRKARKMTQKAVARAGGLQQKTVSLLETHPDRCSVDSLMRYLSAVKANVALDLKTDAPAPAKGKW